MSLMHVLLGPADFGDQIPDRDSCIYWRDDLSVGPVPATETWEDLSCIREAFWKTFTPLGRPSDMNQDRETPEELGGSKLAEAATDMSQRDDQLRRLGESSEIVIWCSSNRTEIFMLFALLNSLDPLMAPAMRMTVAQCAQWGPRTHRAKHLVEFFHARWLIPPDFVALARAAWMRYTAPDPMGLNDLVDRLQDLSDPQLGNVLLRVLEEYPATGNGLSQIEEKMLQLVGEGNSVIKVVANIMGTSEDLFGGWMPFRRMWDFASSEQPVLELVEGTLRADLDSALAFRKSIVHLSDYGKQLLSGRCDYVSVTGLDRWIGGVHLRGHTVPWRYDPKAKRLVKA